jgi:hypothetical protein
MNYNEVLEAFRHFARQCKNCEYYAECKIALPELSKIIIYNMFLNQIDRLSFSDVKDLESYNLIHKYITELQNKGYVQFDK